MMTMRVPSDMMDRETMVAFSPNPESSTTNDGQPRNDMERLGTTRKRTHNEPERGKLAITATQPYGDVDTNGIELHGQTTLTERFEEHQVDGMQEVVNKSITDGCIRNKEEEHRRPGWTHAPRLTLIWSHTEVPPRLTKATDTESIGALPEGARHQT